MTRVVGCFLALALIFAPAALAQDMGDPAQPPEDVNPTEEEMQYVAEIYLEVEALQAEYREEFAQADDPEQAQQLQQQLQQEADEIIEAHGGIEIERYQEILVAAQQDPELRDELLELIEEERGDQPAPQQQQPPQN